MQPARSSPRPRRNATGGDVLALTDTAARTLDGHPGISSVAGQDGHQVGASSYADRHIVGSLDPATCRPTLVTGLRFPPSGQNTSVFLPHRATGWTSTDPALTVPGIGPGREGAETTS